MGEAKNIYFTCLNCCDFCGSPMFCCTTPTSPTMNITVVHGFSKIPLTLDNLSESTLDDLATQLQEKTGVPKESQKIIFKGKTLSDRSQCLDNLGLKPGAKLMLIGKKFCPEEEAAFRQLDDIKSQAQSLATKLEELEKDFINVSGAFLSKELVPDRLDQMRKVILSLSEQGMKLLTSLDAVRLERNSDTALSEAAKSEFEVNRKSLVHRVNSLMDAVDSLLIKVDDMKEGLFAHPRCSRI